MAVGYSREYALAFIDNRGEIKLSDNEWHGKTRTRVFTMTQGVDANLLQNDTIKLVTMYPGERVLGGHLAFEACGTVTVDIGDGTDADRFCDGADISVAGSATFGDEISLGFLDAVVTAFDLTMTILGGAVTAGKKISGIISYVRD